MSLPENKSSLLESANRCELMHQGGEADVYLLYLNNGTCLTLKWYKQSFNTALIENLINIKDDGIYRVRESGFFQNTPYQLYDFVKGVSSSALGCLPLPVALSALRMVVASLGNALRVHVSHGDLNPSNILFSLRESKEGSSFQTVLIDWGISGPGALPFASPERFQGKQPDEKSDIFSLGLLLYRWITGENLVEESGFDEFASRMSRLDARGVSENLFLSGKFSPGEISALESVWKACLENSPDDRAEDLDELDELLEIALEKVSGGEVSQTSCIRKFTEELVPHIEKLGQNVSSDIKKGNPVDFPFKKTAEKSRKNPLKIAVLGVTGLLLVVLLIYAVVGTDSSNVDETGLMFLKKSRSLESEFIDETEDVDSLISSENVEQIMDVLNDLPTPSKE